MMEKWRTKRSWLPWGLALGGLGTMAVGIAGSLGGGCSFQPNDFQCGYPSPDDPTVAPVCNKPLQVCVCARGWCAEQVDVGDGGDGEGCPSGLRYVDPPFASPPAGDRCVDMDDAVSVVPSGAANAFCGDAGPPPSGAADGGASDGGDGGPSADAGDGGDGGPGADAGDGGGSGPGADAGDGGDGGGGA